VFCVFMSKATFSNSEEVVVSRHIGTGGLIYSIFRPGSALEALIYQGPTTGFLNKSASP
jgi:hypothetical protein